MYIVSPRSWSELHQSHYRLCTLEQMCTRHQYCQRRDWSPCFKNKGKCSGNEALWCSNHIVSLYIQRRRQQSCPYMHWLCPVKPWITIDLFWAGNSTWWSSNQSWIWFPAGGSPQKYIAHSRFLKCDLDSQSRSWRWIMMAYFKHSRRDGSNTSLDRTGRLTLYHPTKVYSSSRDSMLASSGIWHDRSPRRYGMLGGGFCAISLLLSAWPIMWVPTFLLSSDLISYL